MLSQKKPLLKVLRIVFAVAPLVWIYSRTNFSSIVEILKTAPILVLVLITAITFSTMLLQGIRWWVLVKKFIPDLKLLTTVRVHLESTFYAIALPSSAAQDIVRAVILSRKHSGSVIWASSWIARLTGLAVLMFFSFLGLTTMDNQVLPSGIRLTLFSMFGVTLVMGIASFSKTITRPFRKLETNFPESKIITTLSQLRNSIYNYKNAPATLLNALALSLITQLLLILNAALIFFAVTGQYYFLESLAFIPLIEILSISLPLTPGGIGIREALMALMFRQLNLSADQLGSFVAISLLISLSRLLGAVPLLYRGISKKSIKTSNA